MNTLSPELSAAAMIAMFSGLLWVPIILNRLHEMGPWKALKNPEPDVRPESDWAYRLANAHRNAIENLAVFAPLALTIHILEVGDSTTGLACMIFVGARVAHAFIYTAGIGFFRTVAFVVGFVAQVILFLRIVGWV